MRRYIFILTILNIAIQSYSAEVTWLGTTDANWGNGVNWSSGTMPSSSDDVIIPTTSNDPVVDRVSRSVKSLTIQNGATLHLHSSIGSNFDVNGNLTVDGNLITNYCRVNFTSSSSTPIISGSSTITFNDIYIDNGAHLQLQTDVIVDGNVNITGGMISLGNNDITFSNSSSISYYSSSNYLVTNGTGEVIFQNIGPGGKSGDIFIPVGPTSSNYTPVIINNDAGTAADNFSIRIAANIYDEGTGGNAYTSGAVGLTWHIGEDTPGGSQVDMTIHWHYSNQLTAFNSSNCVLSHYNGTQWEALADLSAATTAWGYGYNVTYKTTATATSFSPFGIVSSPEILPVEFISFDATPLEDRVLLTWETATEENNDYFLLQKSRDGVNFEAIEQIMGFGTTNEKQVYRTHDISPYLGQSYYRLKQVDFDGQFDFSKIIAVHYDGAYAGDTQLKLACHINGHRYPILTNQFNQGERITVSLVNVTGQILFRKSFDIGGSGTFEKSLNINSQLKTGIYQLVYTSGSRLDSKKILVR